MMFETVEKKLQHRAPAVQLAMREVVANTQGVKITEENVLPL